MNEHLRGKYTVPRTVISQPYKSRTGNSNGRTKSKMPSLVPCKRNPASTTAFKPDPQKPKPGERAMLVSGGTGKKRMVWL